MVEERGTSRQLFFLLFINDLANVSKVLMLISTNEVKMVALRPTCGKLQLHCLEGLGLFFRNFSKCNYITTEQTPICSYHLARQLEAIPFRWQP